MRVALVSGYDLSIPGGVQGQVRALAGELARRGLEVAVVTPFAKGAGPSPLPASVELLRAGRGIGLPVNGSVAPVAPTPLAAASAIRALSSFRPDVVHVHEPLVPGPPLAAVLAGPRPIVATFHRAGADRLYRAAGRVFGPVAGRRIDVAIAVSAAAAVTAGEVFGRHLEAIGEVGNGVELSRFQRARLPFEGDPSTSRTWKNGEYPVVAFAGRHEQRKGLAVLLDAFAGLAEDVRLDVIGDGPESASLRRRSAGAPRVCWRGAVDDEELARVLARADVFAAPSVGGESFGVVLLEAMAAGTAVVASDIAGYRLAAGDAAVFVPPADATALAGAISALLAHHRERRDLVGRGFARALACSAPVLADRYVEIYRGALSPTAARRSGASGRLS
ncbi:MAG: glycosyltransferase family 4 protein [Acidimicrobiales bacterium]